MKQISKVMVGASLALLILSGCTDESPEQIKHTQNNALEELIFTAKSFQRVGDIDSRTALIMPDNENENAEFIWTAGDTIGVVPSEGAQAYFIIGEGVETNKATFSGGSWALKTQNSNDYAAYYPLVYDMMLDRTQVPVDYTGQVYKPAASNKLSSLASHDYMAAKATMATGANNVNFEFKHLSALMEIQFAVPEASEVTQVTLTSDEKIFPIKGTFNLEAETVTITSTSDDFVNSLTIKVKELETTEANEMVSVFFMTPPMDLSGKTLDMTITYGEQEKHLEVTGGVNMSAGMWYTLVAEEYNQQPAYIQLASDFSTSLNDALGTLGGTKLKFVPNSNTTSETVVFEDVENGVNAYAVKNGDWLEVHTAAKEFMAPENCKNAFYATSDVNSFASLTAIDLTGFNTSKVTNMEMMFYWCHLLESITFGDEFITSNVTNMIHMFSSCSSLTSLNLSNFNTASVTHMHYMFDNCSSLTSIVFGDGFDTSSVTWMLNMFRGCSSLTSIDLSIFDTSSVKFMDLMFEGCSSLTSIDLSNFNTSQLTNTSGMFRDCTSLEDVTFGDNFDTSGVLSMDGMFYGCSSLKSLDLSSFDASSVESTAFMFTNCSTLETVVFGDSFKTPSLTDMNWMFEGCSSLITVDMSNFDTSSVTTMMGLFNGCTSLESVDLSNFDTSMVNSMSLMFNNCKKLTTLDLSGFTFLDDLVIVGCSDMFNMIGAECENKPINIYVTAEGKSFLEREYVHVDPSNAQLVVKEQ